MRQTKKEIIKKYFKTDAEMYVFILNYCDSKVRIELLGIDKFHYFNREAADRWYDRIFSTINEENNISVPVKEVESALNNLNRLHLNMIE